MKRIIDRFGGLIMAVCEILVGAVLFWDHEKFSMGIIMTAGVLLVSAGIINMINYFRKSPEDGAESMAMTLGLLYIIVGFFCVFQAQWFLDTFPLITVLYGAALMLLGIRKIAVSIDLVRLHARHWYWRLIGGLVTSVCAVVIMYNPFDKRDMLWMFVKTAFIVVGVIDIAALIAGALKKGGNQEDDSEEE